MIMSASKLLLNLLFLSFLGSAFVFAAFSSSTYEEALSAIAETEETAFSAYRAVLDAESAGANVSNLILKLNMAAELLAKANMFFRSNDYDTALIFASNATAIANNVKVEAYNNRDIALHNSFEHFFFSLVESILGVCAVALLSLLSWRLFKRWYYHHLERLKPELKSNEP